MFSPEFENLIRLSGEIWASLRCDELSRALLVDWLSPEQLDQYTYSGGNSFEVTGSGGHRYRITDNRVYGVFRLDAEGREEEKICFLPATPVNPAIGDIMLAQKIALETDEEKALAVANRYSTSWTGLTPAAG